MIDFSCLDGANGLDFQCFNKLFSFIINDLIKQFYCKKPKRHFQIIYIAVFYNHQYNLMEDYFYQNAKNTNSF